MAKKNKAIEQPVSPEMLERIDESRANPEPGIPQEEIEREYHHMSGAEAKAHLRKIRRKQRLAEKGY